MCIRDSLLTGGNAQCIPTYIRQRVTGNALAIFDPPEWLVTRKALVFDVLVSLHEFARTEQDMRIQHH